MNGELFLKIMHTDAYRTCIQKSVLKASCLSGHLDHAMGALYNPARRIFILYGCSVQITASKLLHNLRAQQSGHCLP